MFLAEVEAPVLPNTSIHLRPVVEQAAPNINAAIIPTVACLIRRRNDTLRIFPVRLVGIPLRRPLLPPRCQLHPSPSSPAGCQAETSRCWAEAKRPLDCERNTPKNWPRRLLLLLPPRVDSQVNPAAKASPAPRRQRNCSVLGRWRCAESE